MTASPGGGSGNAAGSPAACPGRRSAAVPVRCRARRGRRRRPRTRLAQPSATAGRPPCRSAGPCGRPPRRPGRRWPRSVPSGRPSPGPHPRRAIGSPPPRYRRPARRPAPSRRPSRRPAGRAPPAGAGGTGPPTPRTGPGCWRGSRRWPGIRLRRHRRSRVCAPGRPRPRGAVAPGPSGGPPRPAPPRWRSCAQPRTSAGWKVMARTSF